MTEATKMTRAEADTLHAEVADEIAERVSQLEATPRYAKLDRSALLSIAIKEQFRKRPAYAEAWKNAPGKMSSRADE